MSEELNATAGSGDRAEPDTVAVEPLPEKDRQPDHPALLSALGAGVGEIDLAAAGERFTITGIV